MESLLENLSNNLKITMFTSIEEFLLRNSKNYISLMKFLSKALKMDGNFKYKKIIIQFIVKYVEKIPSSQYVGLNNLCEFIEDCEYWDLVIDVLYILGEYGPRQNYCSHYIRFIFNRILLELPIIRAGAISALLKFGERIGSLSNEIVSLLRCCLSDDDDIVRDRAAITAKYLYVNKEKLMLNYRQNFSLVDLEHSLQKYIKSLNKDVAFDFTMIILTKNKKLESINNNYNKNLHNNIKSLPSKNNYLNIFNKLSYSTNYGKIFKSTKLFNLTEDESEYKILMMKHIFKTHIILQFILQNNIEQSVISNVKIEIKYDAKLFKVKDKTDCKEISKNQIKYLFICLKFDEEKIIKKLTKSQLEMDAILKYTIKENNKKEYEDEYVLNPIKLYFKDFITGGENINKLCFKKEFLSIANPSKLKFNLFTMNLQTAIYFIKNRIGLDEIIKKHIRKNKKKNQVIIHFSGLNINNDRIYIHCLLKKKKSTKERNKIQVNIAIVSDCFILTQTLLNTLK